MCFNRLYILLDAFLIEVFLLCGVVFAHLYYTRAIARRGSSGRTRVRTTVVRHMPPLQCMHLRGIL